MPHEREQRAAALFQAALMLDAAGRVAFLREQCVGDDALHADVRSLLEADAVAGGFLEIPALRHPAGPTVEDAAQRLIDKHIGRYHIRRLLAAGGMGSVYEAVQDHPHRTVALKLMKQGIASRSALRRFEYESQILARLRHSGIAQVFDAGVHDDGSGGVPYFVMEYIPNAMTLTDHARSKDLGTRQRLELFMQVCDALHHGHQKGIIHRDLKPANILVDSAGLAKVIDFGVARATDSDLAVTTVQTDVGQLVGTLQYMSPEQVMADPHDLDVRSDVYALGVVLYELLCGRLPYDVSSVRVYEATRIIREQTPARPSSFDRALRGDLETIVFKALEKDRVRRYQSAADLSADIRRYLTNQPITARPPTMVYQLRTFARRNKALVSGVVATFLVLLAALAVVSIMALRIQRESARRAEINTFLESLLMAADPFPIVDSNQRFGANVLWIDVIDDAIKRLDSEPLTDREAEATIRHRMGLACFWMARYDQAYANLQKALAIRRERLGEDHPHTLESKTGVVWCKTYLFDSYEAERLGRETVADCKRTLGAADPRTLAAMHAHMLAVMNAGYHDEMVAIAQEMYDIGKANPGVFPIDIAMGFVAKGLVDNGRLNEAEPILKSIIAQAEAINANSLTQGFAHVVMGVLWDARGDDRKAEEHIRRGADIWTSRSGPGYLEFSVMLAWIMCEQDDRREQGLALVSDTMRMAREQYGTTHPIMTMIAARASDVFVAAGRLDEAEAAMRDAVRAMEVGRHVPLVRHVIMLRDQSQILRARGNLEGAETAMRQAVALADEFSPEKWRRHYEGSPALVWVEMGAVLDAQGRRGEADAWYARARDELSQRPNVDVAPTAISVLYHSGRRAEAEPIARGMLDARRRDPRTTPAQLAVALRLLGDVHEALGRLDEAEQSCQEQVQVLKASLGDGHIHTLDAMNNLAWLIADARGRPADGVPFARAAVEGYRRLNAPNAYDLINTIDTLAAILCRLDQLDESAALFSEMRDRWVEAHPADEPFDPYFGTHFGECLLKMRRFDEAESMLQASLATYADAANPQDREDTLQRLVELYEAWGKPAKAAEYRAMSRGSP